MNAHELRQLDRKIAEMLGWRIEECGENFYKQKLYHVWTPDGKPVRYLTLSYPQEYTDVIVDLVANGEQIRPAMYPSYTTDMNAALSLVNGKPDLYWNLDGGNGITGARLYKVGVADVWEYGGEPALTLCQAWLAYMEKAKQAESETP